MILLAQYPMPENCQILTPPKLNEELQGLLGKFQLGRSKAGAVGFLFGYTVQAAARLLLKTKSTGIWIPLMHRTLFHTPIHKMQSIHFTDFSLWFILQGAAYKYPGNSHKILKLTRFQLENSKNGGARSWWPKRMSSFGGKVLYYPITHIRASHYIHTKLHNYLQQ